MADVPNHVISPRYNLILPIVGFQVEKKHSGPRAKKELWQPVTVLIEHYDVACTHVELEIDKGVPKERLRIIALVDENHDPFTSLKESMEIPLRS